METNQFRDPFTVEETRFRQEIERRLSAVEARPQVVAPAMLQPTPLNIAPDASWVSDVTDADFIVVWQFGVRRWSHPAVWCILAWATDAATTGEIRIQASGGAIADVVSLGANSFGEIEYNWLHQEELWSPPGSAQALWVEARRTSGAGVVRVGCPHAALIDPLGATLAGV